MGRLFWKLFATLFVAQLVTVAVVSTLFWLRHLEREQEAQRELQAMRRERVDGPSTADAWRGPNGGDPWALPSGPAPGRWRDGPPPDDASRAWGDLGPSRPAAPPFSLGPRPPGSFGPGADPAGPPQTEHMRSEMPLVPICVGLVASLLFALALAHHLARPIVALRSAFGEVVRGRFDVNVTEKMRGRRDELADLGRQFDRTAQQLKGLLNHQRRLLHDVSHELRSPLARIQLAIDLARQQDDKTPALIERVERETGRIDRLIEELLTLSRLEAQSWIALDDDVDLTELVADVIADARFEASSKRCTVEFEDPGEIRIKGHGELLHRAIENIVRNAVRYTFEGTAVSVLLTATRDQVSVTVLDDGPGIPDAALASIFEPFVRLPEQRDIGGYGLGLAITQRIVSGHGGSIVATNRDAGGLSIVLTLPRGAQGI